jgi:hypothetical protein
VEALGRLTEDDLRFLVGPTRMGVWGALSCVRACVRACACVCV